MKKIKLKSKGLVKILNEQKAVNKEIAKVHEELVDADKRRKKLSYKVQRLKDKGTKVLHEALLEQYKMDDLDYAGEMEIIDKDTSEVTINNVFDDNFGDLEKAKEMLLNQKKNKESLWTDEKMLTGHKENV